MFTIFQVSVERRTFKKNGVTQYLIFIKQLKFIYIMTQTGNLKNYINMYIQFSSTRLLSVYESNNLF